MLYIYCVLLRIMVSVYRQAKNLHYISDRSGWLVMWVSLRRTILSACISWKMLACKGYESPVLATKEQVLKSPGSSPPGG